MKERTRKVNELRKRLSNLSDAEKQALISRGIIATVEGRTLSLHNTILIYMQTDGRVPSVVGGYKQWKRAGRQVSKGQHGMLIWFPIGTKDEETGDVLSAEYYQVATVFDISQTEPIETGTA